MWWRLMSCISRSLIFFLESRKSGPYQSINVFSPLSWLSRYNLTFFSFLNALFFPLPELYSFNSFFAFGLIFLLPFFPRLDLVDQPVLLHYLHLHNFYLQVHNFSPLSRHLELDPTTPVLTKKLSLIKYKLLLNMVSRINMSSSITSSICDPDCESWKDVSLWIFLGQQARWLVDTAHLRTGTHQLERPECMGYIVPCGLIA